MGEWKFNYYYGSRLDCPLCKRKFVKQKKPNHLLDSVKCICSWCEYKWEESVLILDENDVEELEPRIDYRYFCDEEEII